ncbi:MAG TPA: 5-formyltetrahydrofolate cyclo-ligase [Rhodanobacteraceae bacterium]|jgi:5-formyltetrahydrofolate cyclo-ligase|nr:5-formyltetrahydrofolate cyclo-ligase [Rhodanobacteraceae bacterium]
MHDEDRAAMRARMSVRRNELAAKQRVEAAASVLHSLEALPEFLTDTNVAGYWAVRGELPLNLAVASLQRRDQHYFLPVLGEARQLGFAEYVQGGALTANRFGIPEPQVPTADLRDASDMDVILLPLLAFDRAGRRLGTGGGWYDTSLEFLRDRTRPGTPLLVGIGYAFQEVAAVPAEAWDVPLDYIATEQELIACTTTATSE